MFYSEGFWNRLADKYSKQPIADEGSYQKKLKETQRYFTPESKVLEFGCGTGSTAITHAPHVADILAVDLSTKMVTIAQEKAKAAGVENVEFKQAVIDDLPLDENHYDVVLGMSILHLVEDRHAVMRRVYKTLKPGGVFISSTVCLGKSMPWMKAVFPLGKAFGLLPMVRMFSEQELQHDLEKAGFVMDYEFLPESGKVAFFVMRKPQVQ